MKRIRQWRRRVAALALLPITATMMTSTIGTASGADAQAARFDASQHRVGPGAKIKVRGQFPPPETTTTTPPPSDGDSTGTPLLTARSTDGAGSHRVTIEFRPAGEKNWRKAKLTTSDREGRYVERVKVKRSGRFRAVSADGRRSEPDLVRVKSKIHARVGEKNPTVGDSVPIKGRVAPGGSRRKVVVSVGGENIDTHTSRTGKFKVKWHASDTGSRKVTVKTKSDKIAAGSKRKIGKVTVFRPAVASYYGPGLYGGQTACGQTLSSSTIGVAHKTMPCGTKLTLRYHGREVNVEVIDRGPYVAGREFDLTEATKNKLGFPSTGTLLTSK